jgi:uncharacterized membrane protein YphA (DoxX/SURF4 family)
MSYVIIVVRVLLGLVFTVFGLDFFLKFMSMPQPELPPAASSLMAAYGPTGFLMIIKVLEIIGGVLLLTGVMVPLGLVILTPIIVNIALFDLLLMQKPGLGGPLLVMAIFLIWAYRANFLPLLAVNAKPSSCCGMKQP